MTFLHCVEKMVDKAPQCYADAPLLLETGLLNGDTAMVRQALEQGVSNSAKNDALFAAVFMRKLYLVPLLLQYGADPTSQQATAALGMAAAKGYKHTVVDLLHAGVRCASALKEAVKNKHVELVDVLLPVSDPKADNSVALWLACKNNDIATVQMLITFSDVQAGNGFMLETTAELGHVEIAKMLLQAGADPRLGESKALAEAVAAGHKDMIDLLFEISDVDVLLDRAGEVRTFWTNEGKQAEGVAYFKEKIQAKRMHEERDLLRQHTHIRSHTKSNALGLGRKI